MGFGLKRWKWLEVAWAEAELFRELDRILRTFLRPIQANFYTQNTLIFGHSVSSHHIQFLVVFIEMDSIISLCDNNISTHLIQLQFKIKQLFS